MTEPLQRVENILDQATKMWQGVLRLIITLSSTFLVLTIALVGYLFPAEKGIPELPVCLIMSWASLFAAVVLGIIAELNEIVTHHNFAMGLLKSIEESDTDFTVSYGGIIWGILSINLFIFAILMLCISLLEGVFEHTIYPYYAGLGVISIATLDVYLIKKRKIYKNNKKI